MRRAAEFTLLVATGALAIAALGGCVVERPLVIERDTVGGRLEDVGHDRASLSPEQYERGRRRILELGPFADPTYRVEASLSRDSARREPGVLAPVDQELADLRKAQQRGLLNPVEFAELEAMIRGQAHKRWPIGATAVIDSSNRRTAPMRLESAPRGIRVERQGESFQ
jgi:hypothetical protein